MSGDQLSIEDALSELGRVIPSRDTDPETSHAAAREIRVKAGSQRALLLYAFSSVEYQDGVSDMTDEQAMWNADGVAPSSEYAKRCSELRDGGFIEETGETRVSTVTGKARIVSRITDKGRAWVRSNR